GHCVGDEPAFPDADAAPYDDSGGSMVDAAPESAAESASPPCDLGKPFERITNVAELNGPTDDESARLTPEQLSVYFSRRGGPQPDQGGFTVFLATRASIGATFGALTPLSLGVDPSGPSVASDRSTLYYASDTGDAGPDILASTLPFGVGTSKSLG